MPRGVPKAGSRRRRSSAETDAVADEPVEIPTLPPPSGVLAAPITIGGAVEAVRVALAPFDAVTRKSILRAANVVLK